MEHSTYLDRPYVAARISVLQRAPQSPEPFYRRMICGILQWIFTSDEEFDVVQDMAIDMRPDFTVFKFLARPGGSMHEYEFLIGETTVPGESWSTFADHLHTACANNNNESKNVYGMLQIGVEVQFYRHLNNLFEAIGGRMHLVNDVNDVIAWAQYMKAKPMPFVNH